MLKKGQEKFKNIFEIHSIPYFGVLCYIEFKTETKCVTY